MIEFLSYTFKIELGLIHSVYMYNEHIFKNIGIDFFLKNLTKHYVEYFEKEVDFIKAKLCIDDKILEVGSGSGRIINTIAPMVKEFYGIDFSELHMKQCAALEKFHTNVRLFLMDARKIRFKEDFFDNILMTFSTLSDLGPDKVRVLRQMKRVLKPRGNILISAYAENAAPFQLELYSNAGFDKIISVTETLVHVKNKDGLEIISERFRKDKLEALFSECGLGVKIYDLTAFTYMCVARKK